MTTEELQAIKDGAEKITAEKIVELKSQLKTEMQNEVAVIKLHSDSEIAKIQKANEDLEAIVVEQGLQIEAAKKDPSIQGSKKAEELNVELKELFKDGDVQTLKAKVRLKAFTADDAISVGSFSNVAGNGTIAGAMSSIRNFFVQLIPGVFAKPIAKSNILDYVDILPMSGDRLVSISETETINISVTAEGVVKPVSKMATSPLTTDAKVASTLWKTTIQMVKFYPLYVQFFFDRLVSLFEKEIPRLVLLEIQANSTAFTPVPAQIFLTNPNNYDALVASIASQVKLGFQPNVYFVSPFAFENMKGLKATDGHYLLANNGSINLLESTINFGTISVKIEMDLELGDDQFIGGDFKCAKVAIDQNLDYVEAHVGEDFEKNMKSHRLEKFYAVNVPLGTKAGITSDTFTNVKALITKV